MSHIYQVRLKDPAGNPVALITDWVSLSWSTRMHQVGSHSLTLYGGSELVDLFELDGQIEIWRKPGANWVLEYEGLHRSESRETFQDGDSKYTALGLDYNDLLDRRIILYPAGSVQASKTGPGETVIKEFVNENAGPGATTPPRLLVSGVLPGLAVQADSGAGSSWTGDHSYRNLIATAREIALASGVDFKVVGTGAALFEFQAKATPWGTDRRYLNIDPTTGLNGSGNAPVVFSLAQGNMGDPFYSLDRRSETTRAIVLGRGSDANREVILRASSEVGASVWNTRETSRQSNGYALAALNSTGDAILEDLQAIELFQFIPIHTDALQYGRDYFFGDLVTARYQGVERHKQIVGVSGTVAEGRETLSIEVSDIG